MTFQFNDVLAARLAEAEAQHIQAFVALEARILDAIEVMEGPGRRTQDELSGAAATLATYGDVIRAQRAELVLEAIRSAPHVKEFAARVEAEEKPQHAGLSGLMNVDVWLTVVVILAGMAIVAGITAAVIRGAVG